LWSAPRRAQLPRNQITLKVIQKCQDAGIELLDIDFEFPIHQLSVNLRVNEESDPAIFSWLRAMPENRRQQLIKGALRTFLDLESENAERNMLTQIRDDIAYIKGLLSSQKQ